MNEAIDLSALNWVQQELGETLKQGRLFLEEYAEGNGGAGSLNNCMVCLHEARGPLRIVELNGADLLATEMEEVLNDLLHERLDNAQAAIESLMQAFIQLPDYLFSLRNSRRESIAVLLPVINELRTLRGATAMPEGNVTGPGLHANLPVTAYDPQQAATLPEADQLARSLRQRFQTGLLDWYRNVDNGAGLQTIIEVIDSLRQASRRQEAACFWWIAGGFAEMLLADPGAATTDSKHLLGQVDRQIKRLVDAGEVDFSAQIPAALLESLLQLIAAGETETGQAGEIRRVFALEAQPPEGEPENVALDGRNKEVLNTVTAAVLEDLEQIKERLDLFKRSAGGADDLSQVVDDLHTLANTLEISGIDDAAGIIENVIWRCREITPATAAATDDVLAGIADSLIDVETSIRDMRARNLTQESGSTTSSLVWNEGLSAVINEIVVAMAAAKEHIDSYMQAPESSAGLESVPGLLQQIRGGLQLVGQDRAAALVEQVGDYFNTALLGSEQLPDAGQLDLLADAICSIEYFVEELGENRIHGGMVLDIAEQSLEKLDSGAASVPAAQDAGSEAPCKQSGTVIPAADTPVISEMQVLADDLDPEIYEIFIEEVEEELAQLARLIPGWIANTNNREMSETICRIFHTLKGSGRMVGALALAEFSWAFENLLNQAVEGNLSEQANFFELVLAAREPLVQLLEQVKNGTAPEADVDALVARAMAMLAPAAPVDSDDQSGPMNTPPVNAVAEEDAAGETAAVNAEDVDAEEPASAVPVSAAEESHPLDALPVLAEDADPEIVEIYMEEAAELLEEISARLPEWVADRDNLEALGTLRRCLHTLKGSGRMAGAMRTGEFSWAIENLLNQVIEGSVPADATLVTVLERMPVSLSGLLAQINGGPPPESDYRALMLAAEQLARGEQPDMSAIADSEPAATDSDGSTAAESSEEPETSDAEVLTEAPDTDDGEPEIIEIFRREAIDHLAAIQVFVEACRAHENGCQVSEPLYRALHTLSGISETAEVPAIHSLAMALYGYFGELNEQQLPVSEAAVDVLGNCRVALADLVEQLPEQDCDTGRLNSLLAAIESLPVRPPVVEDEAQEAPQAEAATGAGDVPDTGCSETGAAGDTETDPVAEDVAANDMGVMQETLTEEPAAPAGDFSGMDPELLDIFIEEATDILNNSEATLRAWQDDRDNRGLIDEFQRQLHTLKGGARMTEIGAIGDLSHSVESMLMRVIDGHVMVSGSLFDCLHDAHDSLTGMLDKVKANEMPASAQQLEQRLEQLADGSATIKPDIAETGGPGVEAAEVVPEQFPESGSGADAVAAPADTTAEDSEDPSGQVAVAVAESVPDEHVEAQSAREQASQPEVVTSSPEDVRQSDVMPRREERRKATRVRADQVRIQADLLDNLVNYTGEINIYRSRLEQQFGLYRFNIDELQQTVSRLRDQMRHLEIETETQILYRYEQETGGTHSGFDPLEMDRYSNLQQMTRSMMESIGDLESIREMMDGTTRDSETLLLQQSRVTTDLQDGLLRTRMIPFASLAPRLRRIVRQAANELGKSVELRLEGAEGEMDRTVIERIIAPLEHMLRNAVDHGIEKPAVRMNAGKPKCGNIKISFYREGHEIVLQIADDGHGIDLQAIRSHAIERGLISGDSGLADDEVMQFILHSGFSTAREVTQISGRGVGMDVVNSEVRQLGGSLRIESEAGNGSLFTMRLPYTLAINHALLVRAGEEKFCIPLGSIEGVVRVAADELLACYAEQEPAYDYAGNSYQLKHLGTLLDSGGMDSGKTGDRLPVLLIRTGEKRVALQVEAMHGNREIVVKPLGVQLSSVNGISGATILGDGRVVLILDLATVVRMEARQPTATDVAVPGGNDKLTVMVVDDSITVRKVTTRLLRRYGFEVVTAKDGVDAIGQLQDRVPDMMLLDIEMPRMDGFELATQMRNNERLRHIPITMITSRTGDKHRERAREIGINHYLGKPYQERELLDTIHRLIGISPDEPAESREHADG